MILSCRNIEKSFGTDIVLKNVSFSIAEYEKAAIVGTNGAGKSTLLKIITGELMADAGTVTLQKGKALGYLAQHPITDTDRTIYDEVLLARQDLLAMEKRIRGLEEQMQSVSGQALTDCLAEYHELLEDFEDRNGYALRSEVTGVLKGLGFAEADFRKSCGTLSGGQKTRVALARLLVTHPDLILLDEPTNHLDIESIEWLETFLLNYKGAVVIVAHDRYFLDKIVSKVIALEQHEAAVYSGNYTAYMAKAKQRREAALRAYENRQREILHEQQVIDKLKQFNREKSISRAESRQKALDRLKPLEKPKTQQAGMRIVLNPRVVSGKDVLQVEALAKSYGEKRLFFDLNFAIKRGERVALIGGNGTGKTTILKILNGRVPADAGTCTTGTNVQIGYYDQEQQNLHMDKTLFCEISDAYPTLSNTRIRTVLAAFLFTEDDVFKKVRDLSGGERGRLSLAKLMLGDANFLILDEPTNHLDMESKEILEDALNSYTGTVLFVSHDRYFVNRTATRILHLTRQRLDSYIGNYDYYLEKREDVERAAEAAVQPKARKRAAASEHVPAAAPEANASPKEETGRADWQEQKARQAEIRRKENRVRKLEEQIGELEAQLSRAQEAYADPVVAADSARLNEIHETCTQLQTQLEALYKEWELLAE